MNIEKGKIIYIICCIAYFFIGYAFYFSFLNLIHSCGQLNITSVSFLFYAKVINGVFFAIISFVATVFMRKKTFSDKDIAIQHMLNLALTILFTFAVKNTFQISCVISSNFYEPFVPLVITFSTIVTLIACVIIKK